MANMITRLTLFPGSGKRIAMLIQGNRVNKETGVLHFTDVDGIHYETTLPFALEFIEEGYKKAPFTE